MHLCRLERLPQLRLAQQTNLAILV